MSEEISRLGGPKNIHDPLFAPNQAADRSSQEIYEFGPFRLQPAERKLLRDGVVVALTPKAFDTLVILVRNSNHLLDKSELIRLLWPDSFVEDGNLSNSIFVLRKALGNNHEYIETVPTRGYRFVGAVRQLPPTAPNSISGALEVQRREAPGNRKLGAWKILLAGIAAAVLLFAAVFFAPRYRRASSAPMPTLPILVTEQRLTANPSDVPVHDAVVSPDGKYVAYADPTGLYLRQVSSGETRRLSLPKDFVASPNSWYPDSAHLLIVKDPEPSWDLSLSKPSLYRLSILGGEPQKIMSDARGGSVSPDGSRIAYLTQANQGDLWIMDTDGTNPRRIVPGSGPNKGQLDRDTINRVAWSPTGQQLAYIERHLLSAPTPVGAINSLRIVDADGGGSGVVLEDARLGQALWWSHDGRILFSYREDAASTQANYGVYSIGFDERNGKAIGPPQPITKAEGRIGGISGTADGKRLVLWRFNTASQMFLSTYDGATRQWKEPRRLTLDTNENLAWAWSADSKAVFLVSNRNGTWKLFKQAVDETTPEELVEGRSISCPRLSADGTQVLYLSSSHPDDVSFPAELMSKPIAGGTPRVVLQGKRITNQQCAMAPATLCIFSQMDGDDYTFRVFDLEHGVGSVLLRLPRQVWTLNRNWSLSPDGSKLALFLDQHRIRFFSISTGAAHDVTVKDWPLHHGDWAANGKTVFMPSRSPDGTPVILEVDQGGKAKVALQGRPNLDFGVMIQSPDSRFALVAEYIPSGNAWIVNDF